jgi:phage tail sheath gpL-like
MGSGLSPTPSWIWAAQVAARDAQRCDSGTPNRPRKGMTLPDCEAPPRGAATRFDWAERNLLLRAGISTFTVDRSGMVSIERLITTYQTNAAGLTDVSYLELGTIRTLDAILRRWISLYAKYQDSMLGPDGDEYGPGVPVLTPNGWKGEVAADYDDIVRAGWCKNAEAFKASMVAEIPTNQTDRLDFEGQPYIMQGLVTLAFKLAFRL